MEPTLQQMPDYIDVDTRNLWFLLHLGTYLDYIMSINYDFLEENINIWRNLVFINFPIVKIDYFYY